MPSNMECPICKTAIDDVRQTPFCPTCQWELVEIPNDSSDELKKYYMKLRTDFQDYFSHIKEKGSLEITIRNLCHENEVLAKKINEDNRDIAIKEEKLNKQREELVRLETIQKNITQVKQELSKINGEIQKAQKQQKKLDDYEKLLQELLDCYNFVNWNGYQDSELNIIKKFLQQKGLLND